MGEIERRSEGEAFLATRVQTNSHFRRVEINTQKKNDSKKVQTPITFKCIQMFITKIPRHLHSGKQLLFISPSLNEKKKNVRGLKNLKKKLVVQKNFFQKFLAPNSN